MLVSVTRLRLRSWRYLPAFILYTRRALGQARAAPGSMWVRVRGGRRLDFWTLTAWTDEASMMRYRNSGAHGKAMPKLKVWCDEASYAHWEQPDGPDVSWAEAERHLAEAGRLSHVRQPSLAQQDGTALGS